METEICDLEENENSAVDVTVYVIKDYFPSAVLPDLHRIISKLDGLRIQLDFNAFIMIEFLTKKKADEAREKGISYVHNGQQYNEKFANIGEVQSYVQDDVETMSVKDIDSSCDFLDLDVLYHRQIYDLDLDRRSIMDQ